MHGVEVLERRRQLTDNHHRVTQVHSADVVTPERVDEALGHPVALWAAYRRSDRLQAQLARDPLGVGGDGGAAVVADELQAMASRHSLGAAEPLLDGQTLVNAICATFARLNTALPKSTPVALTTEFSSNPIKVQHWQAFVTKASLQLPSLNAVVAELAKFLSLALAARRLFGDFEPRSNPVVPEWRGTVPGRG